MYIMCVLFIIVILCIFVGICELIELIFKNHHSYGTKISKLKEVRYKNIFTIIFYVINTETYEFSLNYTKNYLGFNMFKYDAVNIISKFMVSTV